jgi:hypothetical protein
VGVRVIAAYVTAILLAYLFFGMVAFRVADQRFNLMNEECAVIAVFWPVVLCGLLFSGSTQRVAGWCMPRPELPAAKVVKR